MVEVVSAVGGQQSVSYKVENVETREQEKEEPLNTIDLAGRAKIISGFEQHLSSGIYLHVEPYIKIPVTRLATRDLRFSSGGITCKISF